MCTKKHEISEENINHSSLLEMLIEAIKNIVQNQKEIIAMLRPEASRGDGEHNFKTIAENLGQEPENYLSENRENDSKNSEDNEIYSSFRAFKYINVRWKMFGVRKWEIHYSLS